MSEGSPQARQLLAGGIAVAAAMAAIVSLLSRGGVNRDHEVARLYEDCGAAMAALTQDALGRGKRVLVLEHDGSGLPEEERQWMQGQIDGFYAALKSGLEITKQQVGDERAVREEQVSGRAVDPARMREQGYAPLVKKAPAVDVIVSFVGAPPLGAGGAARWKHLPPVVCFSYAGDDVPACMESGVLAFAIAPRRSPVSVKDAKKKSWFEIMSQVVTPDNVHDWAALE